MLDIAGAGNNRTVQALLALVLLGKQVAAAVTAEGELAASGLAYTLFSTAVGLHLGHDNTEGITQGAKYSEAEGLCKGENLHFFGRRIITN